MEEILSPSNIVFILGLLGVLFSVFNYFRNPQIQSDKVDALMEQQMKWFTEATEKRFNSMQQNFDSLLLQSNNHIHTVDTKVDKLHGIVEQTSKEVVKLGTIIEERIPRKN